MFKRIVHILPALCLATGTAWAAQSPFIGDWKLDPRRTRMPDEMKIVRKGANTYAFDFGGGAETVVVDGSDQKGGYGGTLLSVTPQAPDTWIVERKKDGRLLLKATWKLAADGRTLTDYFRQFGSSGALFSMDYVYRRSGAGTGFAADWRSIKETMNSPFPFQVKPFEGDGLSLVTALGKKTQNVTFDGKEHPFEGPDVYKGFTASARRLDARTIEVTDKAGAKLADTETIALSPDLKTLTVTTHTPGSSRPSVMVFERG
ncbi:MAG: hypothetical protein JO261_13880 [Alphaproteobacteria bacterium]|nr:hypothetical protein [Alphaproteobacteria bacterium]MBV9694782.1 hypothetical protein [Alphaproteobacteria bacterium]